MKLSGWASLWIVASVAWWVYCAYWLWTNYPRLPSIEACRELIYYSCSAKVYVEVWSRWYVGLAFGVLAPAGAAFLFKGLIAGFRRLRRRPASKISN